MACAGALTSIIMTAASSYVANGGLDGLVGDAPIAAGGNAVGVGINDTFTQVGQNFQFSLDVAPTMSTVNSATNAIAGQTWYSGAINSLKNVVSDIAAFPTELRTSWNTMATDLGTDAAFAVYDLWGSEAALAIGDAVTAGTSQVLDYGLSWVAQNAGGSVAGDVVTSIITGDPGKFGTIVSAAEGYAQLADSFINAAERGANYLEETFTDLENVISGDWSGVNIDFESIGEDIAKLGNTINWENLSNLGSPGQLLANIEFGGTLGPLYDSIGNIEVDEQTAKAIGATITTAVATQLSGGTINVKSLGLDIVQIARRGKDLPPSFQSQLYTVFDDLTPEEVRQVKAILGNTQDAIVKGSDLLDPKKLLPSSYTTLTAPLQTASVGFRAIYENVDGSVNQQFESLGQRLSGILPDDLAVANGALGRSMGQVKGIANTNTASLATALQSMETLKDLPLMKNQTQYVPSNVTEYWQNYFQTDQTSGITLGTGTNGAVRLQDVIGSMAGYNTAGPLQMNAVLLQQLQDEGELTVLYQDSGPSSSSSGLFAIIRYFAANEYGPELVGGVGPEYEVVIPAGVYGAGTYLGDDADEAFANAWQNGLIPAAKTLSQTLYASDVRWEVIQLNTVQYQAQLARERVLQARADLDTATVRKSDQVAINLADSLPNMGLDTTAGGQSELMERIVNYNSLGGQATIAAMREARNLDRLAAANIGQDAPLGTQGFQGEGQFLSSQYTKAEAEDSTIRS